MDVTHLGTFDIPLISNIPNIVYLAPTCVQEYIAMLDWGIEQNKYPVIIRVPNEEPIERDINIQKDYSVLNKYKVEKKGEDIAIIALGSFFTLGQKLEKELKDKKDINATLINPRYITGIDIELLEKLKLKHNMIITLEDGELDGGFGEKITRFYGNSSMKVLNYGANKEFTDRKSLQELYKNYHLTTNQIIEDIER